MSGWRVHHVNLSGLKIDRANLAGASIVNSRLDGMTIDGIEVTELLALGRRRTRHDVAEQERAMMLSDRFWPALARLVRLDMAAGIALAVGLLLWLQWN